MWSSKISLPDLHRPSHLFTIVAHLGWVVLKDTTMTVKCFKMAELDGTIYDIKNFPVIIKQGSNILVDISTVHMNCAFLFYLPSKRCSIFTAPIPAMHWGKDMNKFKPECFINTEPYWWPRDACKHTFRMQNTHTSYPTYSKSLHSPLVIAAALDNALWALKPHVWLWTSLRTMRS